MEMRAYPETYLNRSMTMMGDAFDYAINDCKIKGEDFIKMFTTSSVCKRIENGEANYLTGKSGIEIVLECVFETTGEKIQVEPSEKFARSAEFWCGWAVCYYQWRSSRKYVDIFRTVSYSDIIELYPALHEASEEKFAEIIDQKVKAVYKDTNLKRIRTAYGCSQRQLAEMSGVNLRCIQMYEQKIKDINKAQSSSLYRLAKTLGCSMEDLLE